MDLNTTTRFHSKHKPNPGNGCWEWQAGTDEDGYGRFWVKPQNVGAHRFSWIIQNGSIPDGMQVLHSCDNPKCVNPSHLFLGTPLDNMQDKVKKGRFSAGRCERHGHAKLTNEQALQIRGMRGERKVIADIFGVSRQTVDRIKSGETWRHLS